MSGEQNEIKARWSAKPSGRAWKDSTRALSLVPLPTPSHFSCPWGVRRVLHAKAGLSSIFRCFTKREAVLQGGTSMDLGFRTVSVCAKSLQSCLTLCNRMDYSPPDSSVHEILQARISNSLPFSPPGSSRSRDRTHFSCTGRRILHHSTTWQGQGTGPN